MARKKTPTGYDTVIGKSSTLEGNLSSKGGLRVDGTVIGDLEAKGDVLIGKDGKVTGNITGVNIHLSGTVEGNITATGILKIQSTTKLYGDVTVKSFVADEGAVFHGQCEMLENKENGSKYNDYSFAKLDPKSDEVEVEEEIK